MAKQPPRVIRHDPIGTLAEIAELRLDPRQYGTCSEPVKNHDGSWKSRGCDSYLDCPFSEKDKAGPFNGGVRLVKTTSLGVRKIVQWKDTCFGYLARKEHFEVQDFPYELIAREGEASFKELGSTFRDETIPGQGLVRFVDDRVMVSKIAAFPRPGTNPTLVQESLAAEITEDARAKHKAAQTAEVLGLEAQVAGKGGKR
jgi:hypothetical protein